MDFSTVSSHLPRVRQKAALPFGKRPFPCRGQTVRSMRVLPSASVLLPRYSRLGEDPSDPEPSKHQDEAGAPSGREPSYIGVHPTDDNHPPRHNHVFPHRDAQRSAVEGQLSRLPGQMPCRCRGLRWRRPSARTSSYGPAPFRINQMRVSRHHCMGCHHTGK
jgi:hypothetical protein